MQLKKLLTVITKIFLGCFIVAYPFVVFYALKQNIAVKFIGLILLAMIIFSYLRNKNKYLFMAGSLAAFMVIFFNQEIFLKLYPVLMNASVCSVFALSLRTTPLITQFAQKMQHKSLTKETFIYTRKATKAWAVFMFINTIVSLATVFMSNEIWVLYNGFISYILIGTMMSMEYIIRKVKQQCSRQ